MGKKASMAADFPKPLGVQALTLLAVVAVWELVGRTGVLFPDLFPSVLEIIQSLWLYVTTPLILPHLKASLYEVGGALAVAAMFGIPAGIICGSRNGWLARYSVFATVDASSSNVFA